MPCRGPDYYEDGSGTISKLTSEVNRLTNILCTISKLPPSTTLLYMNSVVPEFGTFIEEHVQVDEERWYQKYKEIYPNFSKKEIAKMVTEGILQK